MKTDLYNVHFSIKLSQVLRVFFILLKMWLADTSILFVSEPASGGAQGSDELFRIETICLANRKTSEV